MRSWLHCEIIFSIAHTLLFNGIRYGQVFLYSEKINREALPRKQHYCDDVDAEDGNAWEGGDYHALSHQKGGRSGRAPSQKMGWRSGGALVHQRGGGSGRGEGCCHTLSHQTGGESEEALRGEEGVEVTYNIVSTEKHSYSFFYRRAILNQSSILGTPYQKLTRGDVDANATGLICQFNLSLARKQMA